MVVLRNGERMRINAVIQAQEARVLQGAELHPALDGAVFGPLPDGSGVEHGIHVKAVGRGSPAWQNELRSEDIITSVNRRRFATLDEFRRLVSGSRELLFSIQRGQRAYFLAIR